MLVFEGRGCDAELEGWGTGGGLAEGEADGWGVTGSWGKRLQPKENRTLIHKKYVATRIIMGI